MAGGAFDSVDIDPSGLIRVFGWSHARTETLRPPVLTAGGAAVGVHKCYRMQRPDVPQAPAHLLNMPGFVFEYRIPEAAYAAPDQTVSISVESHPAKTIQPRRRFALPDYGGLFGATEVLGRENIYGYGLPNTEPNAEVLKLLDATEGSVLDFGCGGGPLVAALRRRGREAHGIEIDRPDIRKALTPEIAPYVTLYDGGFPLPFADNSFDIVVASEVLEHIPNYKDAIAEIARVCRRQVILTVPDMSAIPLGAHHRLVPWHLLESTHLNFFTQESLTECLKPHFGRIDFGRIGQSRINETMYFVSLVADCGSKR